MQRQDYRPSYSGSESDFGGNGSGDQPSSTPATTRNKDPVQPPPSKHIKNDNQSKTSSSSSGSDDDDERRYGNFSWRPTTDACSASYRQLSTLTGTHQYTISGFSLARRSGGGVRLCSDFFEVGGQLFRLEVFPAGHSPKTCKYLSVFLTTPGCQLPNQVVVEVALLDQSGGSKDVVQMHPTSHGPAPAQLPGVVGAFPRFIKGKELRRQGTRYLVNDHLVVRAKVEVLRSWRSIPGSPPFHPPVPLSHSPGTMPPTAPQRTVDYLPTTTTVLTLPSSHNQAHLHSVQHPHSPYTTHTQHPMTSYTNTHAPSYPSCQVSIVPTGSQTAYPSSPAPSAPQSPAQMALTPSPQTTIPLWQGQAPLSSERPSSSSAPYVFINTNPRVMASPAINRPPTPALVCTCGLSLMGHLHNRIPLSSNLHSGHRDANIVGSQLPLGSSANSHNSYAFQPPIKQLINFPPHHQAVSNQLIPSHMDPTRYWACGTGARKGPLTYPAHCPPSATASAAPATGYSPHQPLLEPWLDHEPGYRVAMPLPQPALTS